MQYWQIHILIAIFAWGVGQVLIRRGFSSASPVDTFFMGGVWGFLVYAPYIFIHWNEVHITWKLIAFSFFIILSYLVYYKALSTGNFSINSTVTSTFPLFTIIWAQVFLHEPLTSIQWIGIAFILMGITYLSSNHGEKLEWKNWKEYHFIWPLFAAIYLGTGDFLSKFISNTYSYASIFFVFGLTQFIQGAILKWIQDRGKFDFSLFKNKYTVTGNLLLSAGTLFFYLALFSGYASIIVPVSGSFLIVALLLARIILGEKLTILQYFFIMIIFLGNVLINITV
jgi:DME family drug/metabolite transporter